MAHVTRLARLALVGTMSLAVAGGGPSVRAQTAQSISPDLYADLTWRCVGPFDGGPVASVAGIPGEAGVYVITTPSGGVWKTIDGGDTWTSIERQRVAVTSDPHRWTDPANARRIVRTDAQGIEVSLDGGTTWLASHHLPIAEVAHLTPRAVKAEAIVPPRSIAGEPATVVVADPARAGLLFAGTRDSVDVSFDNGAHWASLRLNLPSVAINDLDIRGNNLVAATQGRSVWQLDDISPLRQLSVAAASAAAILFKPLDAVVIKPASPSDSPAPGANVDYYIGASTSGVLKLEVVDVDGRVIHAATSAAAEPNDRWLAVTRPLPATPGHHRVQWNLRLDPPPALNHRYARLARALFEETPSVPDGPLALPGTYHVKLTAGGRVYTQPLVVHSDPRVTGTAATRLAERQQFALAMKVYDAMQIVHRGFRQIAHLRAAIEPQLASADPQVLATATDLNARLVQLDGSDWTGLFIPDEDPDEFDPDEAEEQGLKHPDFVPPKPVSISKDYDDPTSILGRRYTNVDHAPAFTFISADLGTLLTKAMRMPEVVMPADYDRACGQLSGVLDAWRAMNASELPRVNAALAKRKLPTLPLAASVPTIVCGSKAP